MEIVLDNSRNLIGINQGGVAMKNVIIVIAILFLSQDLFADKLFDHIQDTVKVNPAGNRSDLFYDSLDVRAHRHRFTGWLYDAMVSSPKEWYDTELISYEYYKQFEGKTIGTIKIQPLGCFWPYLR